MYTTYKSFELPSSDITYTGKKYFETLQNVQGTWGLGGVNIPDFGLTELINASRGTTSNPVTNNPAVYAQTGGIPSAQNVSTIPGINTGSYNPPSLISPTTGKIAAPQSTTTTGGSNDYGKLTDTGNKDTIYVDVPGRGQVKLSDLLAEQDRAKQLEERTRNEINTGYNNYFSTLDSILNNDLPAQQSAQLGIAQSQGTQAENTLGAQKEQGLADLATQTRQTEQGQAKSLQSLAEDVRNQFKAGQIYLGARGAGDSSAANQYAYAIAKMGNQGRGNVMQQATEIRNQIADREFKLKNTYNTELNNIKEQVNQKTLEIANWFSQSQQQLKQAKAQGQLSQGQDLANLSKQLLQNATAAMLQTQQEMSTKRSMLDQWAMNNSKTIGDLKSNLAATSAYQAPGIQSQGINGQLQTDSQGNVSYNQPGVGYGTSTTSSDWLKKLYGQA